MGLVDDEGVVAQQLPVMLHLGQQDAVGHDLDEGVVAGLIGEPHLVADRRTDFGAELFGDPLRDGARRDPPGLGMPDLAGDAAAKFQADLRQLRGLPRTGLARDDDHLVVADGRGDLVLPLADRQLRRVGNHGHRVPSRLHPGGRRLQLGGDLAERRVASGRVAQRGGAVQAPAQPVPIARHQPGQACSQLGKRRCQSCGLHSSAREIRTQDGYGVPRWPTIFRPRSFHAGCRAAAPLHHRTGRMDDRQCRGGSRISWLSAALSRCAATRSPSTSSCACRTAASVQAAAKSRPAPPPPQRGRPGGTRRSPACRASLCPRCSRTA